MSDIYGPILPLQLDSRNTSALVRAIQTRINLESGGTLNDFSSASPLAAISEGQAYAQAELLYYLNNLPEAFTLQWLRQLGIQRRIGSRALVDVTFYKAPGFNRVLIIPAGTKVYSDSGLAFVLSNEVRVLESEFSAVGVCRSERWGSIYNVPENSINKIDKNFLGLESLQNTTAASGGKDLESVNDMKRRAFEVLSRRNLTTASDFENEVRFLAPESSIVKVLTYEERYKLSSTFSGNVVICAGDQNGKPLSDSTLSAIIDGIKPKVTIGTNVSIISPEVIPIDVVIEVYYDSLQADGDLSSRANEILQLLQSEIDPATIQLGSSLNYDSLAKAIYFLPFVSSINTLDIKLMIQDSSVIEGLCFGFVGEENEVSGRCDYTYIDVLDKNNKSYNPDSGIVSYKLYNAQITLTDSSNYSPLTYTYSRLYIP